MITGRERTPAPGLLSDLLAKILHYAKYRMAVVFVFNNAEIQCFGTNGGVGVE